MANIIMFHHFFSWKNSDVSKKKKYQSTDFVIYIIFYDK